MQLIARAPWLLIQLALGVLAKAAGTLLGLVMCIPFCWKPCPEWPMPFRLWAVNGDGNPERWGENPRPDWAYRFPALGRWWYCAIRNPMNGFWRLFDDTDQYTSRGNWTETAMEPEDLLSAGQWFAWRWRTYRWMDGLRIVVLHKAFDWSVTYTELYIGWKLGSPVPGLGFGLSFRPWRTVNMRRRHV